jgi:predicted dehydrogenase
MGVKVYRVLMIGCGQIAGLLDRPSEQGAVLTHAQAYRRDGRFVLAACVEPDTERRGRFMATWGVPEGYDDLNGAFEGGRSYDVASLCAATPSHAAILADLAGRPVRAIFAEKPLLATSQERGAIARLERRDAPVVAVNYTRRWDPEIEDLRKSIADGRFGDCRSVAVLYNKGVRNNGSHAIQLLTHLLDQAPSSLILDAVGRWRVDFSANDPTVDALIATRTGTPIHLIGADARDYAVFEITMTFTRGLIEIRDGGWTIRARMAAPSMRFPNYRELETGSESVGGYGKALPRALDNLLACLESGAEPACGMAEALEVERFCETLIETARTCPEKEVTA